MNTETNKVKEKQTPTNPNKPQQTPGPQVEGYELTAEGEYIVITDSGLKPRFFKETFKVPKLVQFSTNMKQLYKIVDKKTDEDGNVTGRRVKDKVVPIVLTEHVLRCANHYIQRYLLIPRLREKYKDQGFRRFRTCEIVKKKKILVDAVLARDVTKTKIEDMSETQLIQFVTFNGIKITLRTYPDLGDKKIAVARAWKKKVAGEKAEAARSKSFQEDMLQAPVGHEDDHVAAEEVDETMFFAESEVEDPFQEGDDDKDNFVSELF